MDLVVGDSTPIWYIGLPDGSPISGNNWTARYFIAPKFGDTAIVQRDLILNDVPVSGGLYATGSHFVFQIFPEESALLTQQKKYAVTVEITNLGIKFNREIARFWVNMLPGG